MKRLSILLGLMISATACFAQESSEKGVSIGEWEFSLPLNIKKTYPDDTVGRNDTIFSYENSKGKYIHIYKKYKQYRSYDGGFFVGLCDAVGGPSEMDVKLGSSVEIGVQNVLSANVRPWKSNKRHSFSFGVGFGWKNYRMKGRQCFFKEGNGDITICNLADKYDDFGSPKFSRLKIFSWQFPVQYHYNITKHNIFSLGGIINLNGDGSIKTRYYDTDGGGHRDTFDDIHTNALTVDLIMSITYRGCGLYFKYNPCEILDTQFAPKFNTISVGAILVGW